jgi:hypothetical protein
MSDESDRFRKRACECRQRAAEERDPEMRRHLTTLSIDLDDEADEMDAEVAKPLADRQR